MHGIKFVPVLFITSGILSGCLTDLVTENHDNDQLKTVISIHANEDTAIVNAYFVHDSVFYYDLASTDQLYTTVEGVDYPLTKSESDQLIKNTDYVPPGKLDFWHQTYSHQLADNQAGKTVDVTFERLDPFVKIVGEAIPTTLKIWVNETWTTVTTALTIPEPPVLITPVADTSYSLLEPVNFSWQPVDDDTKTILEFKSICSELDGGERFLMLDPHVPFSKNRNWKKEVSGNSIDIKPLDFLGFSSLFSSDTATRESLEYRSDRWEYINSLNCEVTIKISSSVKEPLPKYGESSYKQAVNTRSMNGKITINH